MLPILKPDSFIDQNRHLILHSINRQQDTRQISGKRNHSCKIGHQLFSETHSQINDLILKISSWWSWTRIQEDHKCNFHDQIAIYVWPYKNKAPNVNLEGETTHSFLPAIHLSDRFKAQMNQANEWSLWFMITWNTQKEVNITRHFKHHRT